MRTGAPARALAEPNHRIGNAPSLQALGLGRGQLAVVADAVVARPYVNPRPATRDTILEILEAWQGWPQPALPGRGRA